MPAPGPCCCCCGSCCKCSISTSHAPKCYVCVVRMLMCARTGRLRLRQRCVATCYVRVKSKMFYFYFDFTRPKAPLGGMGRRARWHSLRTAGKTIHDKRAEHCRSVVREVFISSYDQSLVVVVFSLTICASPAWRSYCCCGGSSCAVGACDCGRRERFPVL